MKSKTLIPLTLCALMAGAFVAMPSAALADRDYDRSGSRQVQKHRNYQHHGGHYSNHNRFESRRAYRHAQKRRYYSSHRYGHYRSPYSRGYRTYATPHVRFSPGISIWFRLN
jgi:Ni/Co efflux regulator RcnB